MFLTAEIYNFNTTQNLPLKSQQKKSSLKRENYGEKMFKIKIAIGPKVTNLHAFIDQKKREKIFIGKILNKKIKFMLVSEEL